MFLLVNAMVLLTFVISVERYERRGSTAAYAGLTGADLYRHLRTTRRFDAGYGHA